MQPLETALRLGREEMSIRWSHASPRIALDPRAGRITAVAFFGAICWTIWISFTRSRRFPDYAIDWRQTWSRQYTRLFGDNAWQTSLENVI